MTQRRHIYQNVQFFIFSKIKQRRFTLMYFPATCGEKRCTNEKIITTWWRWGLEFCSVYCTV